MSYDLIAIDLDGTLLDGDGEISPANVAMIREARQRNVHVVLATARPPRSSMRYYRQLDLDGPLINYNGAVVYDPPSGQLLLHSPIGPKLARRVVDFAREKMPEVLVSGEILDRWYTDHEDQHYMTQTGKLFRPDSVAPIDEWLVEAVTKLLLLGPPEAMTHLGYALAKEFAHQVTIMQTDGELLQIVHPTVSKLKALRMVAGEWGIRREKVMAIGDHMNDIEMLKWAGLGVAMANAVPAVLEAADAITDRHDRDGVARAIHMYLFDGAPTDAFGSDED
jgi:Cof subfamily protein (haloacid dehalogenase superfamily)